jgi:protein-tyrosine phosphatase
MARALRHAPDRAFHPLRWRAGVRRLQRAGIPRSVLFVCHGNICRSPYAALAMLRELPPELRGKVNALSAGFFGADRPSPEEACVVAAARDIDLGAHCSRLLTRELVRAADLTVVMERVQREQVCRQFGADRQRVLLLGDLDPQPIVTRTVRDPIFQSPEVFAETYARIDRCVQVLVRAICGDDVSKGSAISRHQRPR